MRSDDCHGSWHIWELTMFNVGRIGTGLVGGNLGGWVVDEAEAGG